MKKVLALVVIAGSISLFSCTGGEKKTDDAAAKAADSMKAAKAADSMKAAKMQDSMNKAKMADTSKKAMTDTLKKDVKKVEKDVKKMDKKN